MTQSFDAHLYELDANPIFDEDGEYADNRWETLGIGFEYEDAGIRDDYDNYDDTEYECGVSGCLISHYYADEAFECIDRN